MASHVAAKLWPANHPPGSQPGTQSASSFPARDLASQSTTKPPAGRESGKQFCALLPTYEHVLLEEADAIQPQQYTNVYDETLQANNTMQNTFGTRMPIANNTHINYHWVCIRTSLCACDVEEHSHRHTTTHTMRQHSTIVCEYINR